MRFHFGVIACIVPIACSDLALAQSSRCRDAVDQYNSAISEVSNRLRRYSTCVADSKGSDDCSSEFRRLRSAQSDFETAVSTYQSDCR